MNDQERAELLQRAVKSMEGFKADADKSCQHPLYGDTTMMSAGLSELFNERLQDMLQAGVDAEDLRYCFLTDRDFSMVGRGKGSYNGVSCVTVSMRAQDALRAAERFRAKQEGEAEASPS